MTYNKMMNNLLGKIEQDQSILSATTGFFDCCRQEGMIEGLRYAYVLAKFCSRDLQDCLEEEIAENKDYITLDDEAKARAKALARDTSEPIIEGHIKGLEYALAMLIGEKV